MKHLILVVLMLVVMGQRWEYAGGPAGFPICRWVEGDLADVMLRCEPSRDWYQRVYVIGEVPVYPPIGFMWDIVPEERFTIPVPNVPTKAMTREEAEKANREGL